MSAMPTTLAEGTLSDHAAALLASLQNIQAAANNATELLEQAGFAGMRGDTADDLRSALAVHGPTSPVQREGTHQLRHIDLLYLRIVINGRGPRCC